MKRIFTIFNLLAICLLSSAAQYELTLADVDFDKATGTITAYNNTTEKDIIIPEQLDGVDVTSIAQGAFFRKELIGVTLPNTLVNIGLGAFNENKIARLSMGNAIKTIGQSAFRGLKVTDINIPATVTSIGGGVFNGSKIKTINGVATNGIIYARKADGTEDLSTIVSYCGEATVMDFIPNTVTTIGYSAFNSSSLTDIIIPQSVTTIESGSFQHNNFTTLNIPSTVRFINTGAFYNSTSGDITLSQEYEGYQIVWKDGNGNTANKITNFFETYSSTATPIEYTITYHTNGGTHTNPATYNVETETFNLGGASKTGERFVAWYKNANISGARITKIEKGTTGNIDLYARYQGTPYTITEDDVVYEVDSRYNSTGIRDYINTVEKDIIIPDQLGGENVIDIYDRAFKNNRLVGVTLPNTAVNIAPTAFMDNNITRLDLGTTRYIQHNSFQGNKISKLVIPSSVKSISDDAFKDNSITELTIPNSVTSIGAAAFNKNKIKTINGEASNGIIYARNSNGTENETTIVSYGGEAKVIDFIPETVTKIGKYAFTGSYNNYLTSVTIPESVTTISDYAFYYNKLTNVTLSNSVSYIGKYAFYDNSTLTEVALPAEKPGYTIRWKNASGTEVEKITDFKLIHTATKTPIDYTINYVADGGTHTNPTTYNIETETFPLTDATKAGETFVAWYSNANISGARVTEIAKGTYGNIDLYARYQSTPYTLTIDDVDFDKTTGTITGYKNTVEKDIIIPEQLDGVDVTIIGVRAFREKELVDVVIPNTVTKIEQLAFLSNKLTEINISATVTSIGGAAFNGNKVKTINGTETNGIIYARNTDGTEDHTTIVSYCGEDTVVDFIPNTVTNIGYGAFAVSELTDVTMPNSITSIGESAFQVNSLTKIVIPNGVTTIETYAFGDNLLSEVVLPNKLSSINNYAFAGNKLSQVNLPNSVNSIGKYAFASNPSLSEIALPTEREGYKLEWKNNSGTVLVKITDFENKQYSTTVTTTPVEYTITYNTDGGTHANPDTYNIESNTITLSEATKDGKTFVAWYSNAEFTGDAITEIATGSFGNVELWAKYKTTTAIDNTNANSFKAYPNPTTGIIYLEGVEFGDTYAIYSLSGAIVKQGIVDAKKLNITDFNSGIYMLKINNQVVNIIKE